MAIKVICIIILATLVYVNCECSSESLRQFAIDACHITKRSTHFKSSHFKNEGYEVEHVKPKYHNHHNKLSHTKKLTREDFPSGAYLLLHPATNLQHNKYENEIDEQPNYDSVDDEEILANEILTMDLEKNRQRHHKHKHTYRFKRNTPAEILIEHCCSQASMDVCGKYFCH
ncbi:hypothetical protein PVAND_007883 [Polypedilum vanderplanki]|uniref:Uncharacterized protein n=1 Tax=Polypedilum vanderplanki TaxID=319348 RepID=A0A9J6C967_POLVA|nr:hypothetical protein PVAND_007883 [Polypedilum vanderplanki]